MARIPTFEQLGETPAPRPSGGVVPIRATAPSETAPAEAIAEVGQQRVADSTTLWRMVKQEEERANSVRVEDAWNQYQSAALETMRGEKGVLNLKAGLAVNGDMLGTVSRGLADARRKITSTLLNDEQRLLFNRRADVTDLQSKREVLVHHANEQRAYEKQTLEGTIAAETANVTARPDDELAFRGSVLRLRDRGAAFMRSEGIIDDQAIKAYQNGLSDTLWAARIKKLMYPNPESAENLFRAAEPEIHDPKVRDQLRAEIRNAAMPFRAGQSAERIISEVRAIPTRTKIFGPPGTRDKEAAAIDAALARDPQNPDLLEAKYALTEINPEDAARGIPNAKMVAAQLPIALARVDVEATRLYGSDKNNVDRQVFSRMLETELRQKNATDVQALRAIQNVMLDELGAIVRKPELIGQKGAAPPLSEYMKDENFARKFSMLDHAGQVAIANEARVMANQEGKGDPALVESLTKRLYLPPDDPNRINSWTSIMNDPGVYRLTPAQRNQLHADFSRAQTEEGRSYLNLRRAVESSVARTYHGDQILTMGGTNLSKSELALQLWRSNADKIVADYNKNNKNITPLFDPNSKEYLASPAELSRWSAAAGGMPAGPTLSTMADQQRKGESIKMPDTIKTPEQVRTWVNTLPANVTHAIGPDNKPYDITKLRQPSAATATTAPAAAPATSPSAPPGAIVLDQSGELRQLPAPQPAAPEAAAKPAEPVDKDVMPKRLKPGTIAKRIAQSGERWSIERQRRAQRVKERLPEIIAGLKRAGIAMLPFVGVAGNVADIIAATTDPAGRAIGRAIPTELQRIQDGFREVVKRGFSEHDEDVIQAAIDIGEPFFTRREMEKARYMLDELKK